MALSIKSDRADQVARELAKLTGESITDAVVAWLEASLEYERHPASLNLGDTFRALNLANPLKQPDFPVRFRHKRHYAALMVGRNDSFPRFHESSGHGQLSSRGRRR